MPTSEPLTIHILVVVDEETLSDLLSTGLVGYEGYQSWSPLGGVQRYRAQNPHQIHNMLSDPLIREIAETYTKTPAQIVLRWHLQHGLSAIPKSIQPERIAQNIDLFDFHFSSEDMARIDSLTSDTRSWQDPDRVDTKLFPFTTQAVILALRAQGT